MANHLGEWKSTFLFRNSSRCLGRANTIINLTLHGRLLPHLLTLLRDSFKTCASWRKSLRRTCCLRILKLPSKSRQADKKKGPPYPCKARVKKILFVSSPLTMPGTLIKAVKKMAELRIRVKIDQKAQTFSITSAPSLFAVRAKTSRALVANGQSNQELQRLDKQTESRTLMSKQHPAHPVITQSHLRLRKPLNGHSSI